MAVIESVGLLTELSVRLNQQLIEAASGTDSKKANLQDLVRQYTAFFTAYNLVVGYSHEKIPPKDKVLEQLDVTKSAVQAFSKDSNLSEQLRRLDGIMGNIRSGDNSGKTKSKNVKKGRYEELVEAVQKRFPNDSQTCNGVAVAIGSADIAPVYMIGGDFQAYYSRVYTVYQLLIGDLEKLAGASQETLADYYSRVLPTSLGGMLGEANNDAGKADNRSIRELLAMSAGDYLKWLMKRISLDHYIHDQSVGLLGLLKSSGIDADVSPEITNSLVRAVAAVVSFQRKQVDTARTLAEGIFHEMDDLRGAKLAPVVQEMKKIVGDLQRASTDIYQYRQTQDGIMKVFTPDLPNNYNIAGTALAKPIVIEDVIFSDPTRIADLRKILEQYIERLDVAYKVLVPVEQYYVTMLTSMAEVNKCLRLIISNAAVRDQRLKLVEAYVRLTLLREMWKTRVDGLSVTDANENQSDTEALLSRLESTFPGVPRLYNDELNLDAVETLLGKY